MEPKGTAFDALLNGSRALSAKKRSRSIGGSSGGGGDPLLSPSPKQCRNSIHGDSGIIKPEHQLQFLREKVKLLKTKPESLNKDSLKFNDEFPFLFLCLAFELISEERSMIIRRQIACNLFQIAMYSSNPQRNLCEILSLSNYKLVPAYEDAGADQLGIGENTVVVALAQAYGCSEKELKKQSKILGDLGLVAEKARLTQSRLCNPKPLTLSYVYDKFRKIADESGAGSKVKKIGFIKGLLAASRDCEPKYLIRLLLPKTGLRINCSETTFLDALGRASVFLKIGKQISPEQGAEIVKQTYKVLPVYERIVETICNCGVSNLLETCTLSLGIPVEPMLSKAIGSVEDVAKEFSGLRHTCEYKYDGERAQIHFMEDGRIEIYSRNLERSTEKYPDVAENIRRLKACTVSSFILDCEIVGYDRGRKEILSFQKLSSRGRKGVKIDDIKVDVCVFAFDLLYLNGESLVKEELSTRRSHLKESFKEDVGYLQFASDLTSDDPEQLRKFLEESVSASCEGLIFKPTGSKYEPGKRNWLKLKKDFIDSLWDSLDLVPIGACYGRGKREGVYGTFLLACYNPDSGEFQTICKTGTGLSDDLLDELHKDLKVIENVKPYYKYNADKGQPDVWFEPSKVWEVRAGGLTISPAYSAAIGLIDSDNKGLSLRNPTLLRIRDDKKPEQATTAEQVADMWKKQSCSTELGAASNTVPVSAKVDY